MGAAAHIARRLIVLLLIGLGTSCVCLALQAVTATLGTRFAAWSTAAGPGKRPKLSTFGRISALLVLLMLGNILQVLLWALLFWLLGGFDTFEIASYFSGVTFTSLGYGDFTLPPGLRLLAPLEAANGLVMFAITTALLISLIQKAGDRKAS